MTLSCSTHAYDPYARPFTDTIPSKRYESTDDSHHAKFIRLL